MTLGMVTGVSMPKLGTRSEQSSGYMARRKPERSKNDEIITAPTTIARPQIFAGQYLAI